MAAVSRQVGRVGIVYGKTNNGIGMSENTPQPVEINYTRATRQLRVAYDSGEQFEFHAEYLRVYSPSAEVRGHGQGQEVLQTGKEDVGIQAIEPVGNYAVRLRFDDGHASGLYSFDELHRLGRDQEALWSDYLQRLDAAGIQRKTTR